jgi:two-component system, LytTR family, sensor kinase
MNFFSKHRALAHIIFWISIKVYEMLVYSAANNNMASAVKVALVRFPIELFITYFFIGYLLPRYLREKKLLPVLLWAVSVIVLCMFIYLIGRYYLLPETRNGKTLSQIIFYVPYLLMAPFYFMLVPAFAIMLKIVKELYTSNKKTEALQKVNIQNEMAFLKAQIHPHFLFNTLNNLYGSSLQAGNHTTTAGIAHLSAIMEYMLYDAVKEKVPVAKELHYISGFIELEKLRYGNRLQVSLDVDKSLEDHEIAPLIFFTFIENAFKHGTSKLEDNTWITIYLHKEENDIVYKVVNSKPLNATEDSSGNNIPRIGLENLKKRLELIYPGLHTMKTVDSGHNFMALLKIRITNEPIVHNN